MSYITWDVRPEIVHLGPFAIRWYGLLFALAFFVAYHIMLRIFLGEHKKQKDLESLTVYMVVATVVGARLGHVLFYDLDTYLQNPIEILMIWKGGLASHGAAVGILIALYLYSRSRPDQSFLWITDRICIVAAQCGTFIRIGNLFNSEIIGKQTDAPWAFIFPYADRTPLVPRHPTQIYEALMYLLIFIVLFLRYRATREKTPEGLLFGMFLVMVFSARFFIEFLKENQSPFENALPINMGQILSIPFVLIGIYFIIRSQRLNRSAAQAVSSQS